MELMSRLNMSWDRIVELAIQCHAIDATAHSLFEDSTVNEKDTVKSIYEELMSKSLIDLAMAMRLKFYQGIDDKCTYKFSLHAGLMYKNPNNPDEKSTHFTLKDICDKIIHADSVFKSTSETDPFTITLLVGRERGVEWHLHLSITLFTQGVINWAIAEKQRGTI